jgi:hypothetical protein
MSLELVATRNLHETPKCTCHDLFRPERNDMAWISLAKAYCPYSYKHATSLCLVFQIQNPSDTW